MSNRADSTRAKDSQYSLIDYLNADATRAFLKITHETYKQAVGDEFGKTVLGFFGDEPDYTCFMPWKVARSPGRATTTPCGGKMAPGGKHATRRT